MKISGFTLVRNGTRFDYPFLESLRSLLPVVDELVVNIGRGDDDTLDLLRRFESEEGRDKVVLFESDWRLDDPDRRRGGHILAEQTNLALDRCSGDWCIYLQADEVLHEADTDGLRLAIEHANSRAEIDGLLFDYNHFYGSFDVVQVSRSAYRSEVRAIRRSSGARSVGDAQSFRLSDGSKLSVLHSRARIFHYGWVRTPDAMRAKTVFMDGLYHGGERTDGQPQTGENHRYKRFWGLRPYRGGHPAVMQERIKARAWSWDLASSPLEWSVRDAKKILLDSIETLTGIRLFEYRSYRLLDDRKSDRR